MRSGYCGAAPPKTPGDYIRSCLQKKYAVVHQGHPSQVGALMADAPALPPAPAASGRPESADAAGLAHAPGGLRSESPRPSSSDAAAPPAHAAAPALAAGGPTSAVLPGLASGVDAARQDGFLSEPPRLDSSDAAAHPAAAPGQEALAIRPAASAWAGPALLERCVDSGAAIGIAALGAATSSCVVYLARRSAAVAD
ncbi:unnamed protein product [Prorocentrum cordatum]|uniref:Uncharacterized protein n=1 Tax=Prorocentrum cordatum TaxID=2364126 RepID=A0ABN9R102_9DINO|nr:unnamed protein product [Polarella glacialis]